MLQSSGTATSDLSISLAHPFNLQIWSFSLLKNLLPLLMLYDHVIVFLFFLMGLSFNIPVGLVTHCLWHWWYFHSNCVNVLSDFRALVMCQPCKCKLRFRVEIVDSWSVSWRNFGHFCLGESLFWNGVAFSSRELFLHNLCLNLREFCGWNLLSQDLVGVIPLQNKFWIPL